MQMTSESLKVEDFQPLAPLVSVYELKPGVHYLWSWQAARTSTTT